MHCVFQGDKYTDRWKYSETQTEKKKGFLTSDFSKRDEFSNTIRTGQYREQLKVRLGQGRQARRLPQPAASIDRASSIKLTHAAAWLRSCKCRQATAHHQHHRGIEVHPANLSSSFSPCTAPHHTLTTSPSRQLVH